MKIEVYAPDDSLIREIDCLGAETIFPGDASPIEASGRCNGCNGEMNEEKVTCYKKDSRIWFVDPASLLINGGWTLHDFTVKSDTKRITVVSTQRFPTDDTKVNKTVNDSVPEVEP